MPRQWIRTSRRSLPDTACADVVYLHDVRPVCFAIADAPYRLSPYRDTRRVQCENCRVRQLSESGFRPRCAHKLASGLLFGALVATIGVVGPSYAAEDTGASGGALVAVAR